MTYNIAVVGATGTVGRELLQILAERNFPVDRVAALASADSIGRKVSFGEEKTLTVDHLDTFDFEGTDIAFFAAGGSVSAVHGARAAAKGCVVIDKSSHFRMDDDVPLVVPEVNRAALAGFDKRRIIASPNCTTIQVAVALQPLQQAVGIKRVLVDTYQSVSGAGKSAMDELFAQTRAIYVNDPTEAQYFTKQIAFNVIPHIDQFMDDGATKEEWKMSQEMKKIFGQPDLPLAATCVRVPVFVGHGAAVHVELAEPLSVSDAYDIWEDAASVAVIDRREDGSYVTPKESVGEDEVFISRLRVCEALSNGLSFWCVSDNLRKGAALNAVQIAEALIDEYL